MLRGALTALVNFPEEERERQPYPAHFQTKRMWVFCLSTELGGEGGSHPAQDLKERLWRSGVLWCWPEAKGMMHQERAGLGVLREWVWPAEIVKIGLSVANSEKVSSITRQ